MRLRLLCKINSACFTFLNLAGLLNSGAWRLIEEYNVPGMGQILAFFKNLIFFFPTDMHDAKMKFHFKYSKWFKNTFVVLTILLLTTGWYLWNRSDENDDGTSSPLKDLSTNKSSLGK